SPRGHAFFSRYPALGPPKRPEASFLTLMMAPWDWISAAVGALGGATPPTLLRRCRTNDHRPAAGERERHGIASDGLVDQAHDLRTSECGRALQVNPTRLAGSLQQFRRIRQILSLIKVQLNGVRAAADGKNA